MGYQYMIRKPTGEDHTQRSGCGTDMFITKRAGLAVATTDPRIHDSPIANGHIRRVRAGGHDRARDLVTKCEGELSPLSEIEPVPVTEVEVPVLEMQVTVTHAAGIDSQ